MSFDWIHFISLAQILYRDAHRLGDREACLRSVISRAYYGAFGLAREKAVREGGVRLSHTSEDHGKIIRFFRKSTDRDYQKIGLALDRLRQQRNKADYEGQFPDLEQQTKLALKRVLKIKRVIL